MSGARHLQFASPEPQPLSSLGFVLQYIPPVPFDAAGFVPFDAADFLAMDATSLETAVTTSTVHESPCKVVLLSLHLFPALFPSRFITTEQCVVKTLRNGIHLRRGYNVSFSYFERCVAFYRPSLPMNVTLCVTTAWWLNW